jgi:uncharacterized protein YmfQ (DUF2313 family)
MRTPQQVQSELLDVSPLGWAWNHDPAGLWATALLPIANEISLVEGSGEAMLLEVDPRNAVNLLPDYERVLGPDPSGAAPPTALADRQALAYQRWTARGGQSIAFFTALAAARGIAITITEHPVPQCGGVVCGGAACGASPTQFYWTVNVPLDRLTPAQCGGVVCGAAACGGTVEPTGLEALFRLYQPAHTQVLFNYTG